MTSKKGRDIESLPANENYPKNKKVTIIVAILSE